jgi:hypothetical protein
MAAGKSNPNFGATAEDYQRFWIEQSRTLMALPARSRFMLADKASHYLYLDVPDLAAETILSVIREVRAE